MPNHIELIPSPALFIKSIAEQGYSLSTALSDLIDNSITAGASRIEILFDRQSKPYRLLIADNGCGMTEGELTENMRFPSSDLESDRRGEDLGRFGLGLKTASFSQARKFTVVSGKKGTTQFTGGTWDLDYLKNNGWLLLINSADEVLKLLNDYSVENKNYHNADPTFSPSTLIVWNNLFKINNAREQEIEDELNEVRSHLSLIFHRYLESGKLTIRFNNEIIAAFNPFPVNLIDVQKVNESNWRSGDSYISFQGIILPKIAILESRAGHSKWTPQGKSLSDMEGLFVYRNQRLIYYGGWLRTKQKSNLLKLGRVKIDITNETDTLFQLNVAKSYLKLPFGLKKAMAEMINTVEIQSIREYKEKITGEIVLKNKSFHSDLQLIRKTVTGGGPQLKINESFLLIRQLLSALDSLGQDKLNALLKLIEKKLNEIWQMDTSSIEVLSDELNDEERKRILNLRSYFIEAGLSSPEVEKWLMSNISQSISHQAYIKSLT